MQVTTLCALLLALGCDGGGGEGSRSDGATGSDQTPPAEVSRNVVSVGAAFEVEFDEPVTTDEASWTVAADGTAQPFTVEVNERTVRVTPRWPFVDAQWSIEGRVEDRAGNSSAVSDWTVQSAGSWGADEAPPSPFSKTVYLAWTTNSTLYGWSYADADEPAIAVARMKDGIWASEGTLPVTLGGATEDTLPRAALRPQEDGSMVLTWEHPGKVWWSHNEGQGWSAPQQTSYNDIAGALQPAGIVFGESKICRLRRFAQGIFGAAETLPLAVAYDGQCEDALAESRAGVTAVTVSEVANRAAVAIHRPSDGWGAAVHIDWPFPAEGSSGPAIFVTDAGETVLLVAHRSTQVGEVVYGAVVSADRVVGKPVRLDVDNDMPERQELVHAQSVGQAAVGWLERRTRSGGAVEASRIVVRKVVDGQFGAPIATPDGEFPLNQIQLTVDALGRLAVTWESDGACVGRLGSQWEVKCDFPQADWWLHHRALVSDVSGRLALAVEGNSSATVTLYQ